MPAPPPAMAAPAARGGRAPARRPAPASPTERQQWHLGLAPRGWLPFRSRVS